MYLFLLDAHTNTLRVEIEAGEPKWLVIISSQQHTNRKYQHLAYFHTFTLDTDVRLNCQDIVCTIAFKSTTAEHKKNDAWLYFESDKWTIFLLFLQVFCNFPASAFAFAITWNGGKNEENLSFVQHLMCSHSLIYCVQRKSFAIYDIVERHSRISRITNELQIKTYSVNDCCGIFMRMERATKKSTHSRSVDLSERFPMLTCYVNCEQASCSHTLIDGCSCLKQTAIFTATTIFLSHIQISKKKNHTKHRSQEKVERMKYLCRMYVIEMEFFLSINLTRWFRVWLLLCTNKIIKMWKMFIKYFD